MAARMSLLLLVVVSAALSAAARKEGPGNLMADTVGDTRRSLLQTTVPTPTVIGSQLPQQVTFPTGGVGGFPIGGVGGFPIGGTGSFFPFQPGQFSGFPAFNPCPAGYTFAFQFGRQQCILSSSLNRQGTFGALGK